MTTTTGVTTAAPGTMTTTAGAVTSTTTPTGVTGTESATGSSATSATIPNSTSATILDPTATRDTTSSDARAPVPIETSGGTPSMGATGKDMPECMSAWDSKTHISKVRWREICQRTLNDPAHL